MGAGAGVGVLALVDDGCVGDLATSGRLPVNRALPVVPPTVRGDSGGVDLAGDASCVDAAAVAGAETVMCGRDDASTTSTWGGVDGGEATTGCSALPLPALMSYTQGC